MPISKQYPSLFVHIPKTGGTSIETALQMFFPWKLENQQQLFGLIQSPILVQQNFLSNYLQHLTATEIFELRPEITDLFSFAFVRNPWDKMISIYSNTDPNLVLEARKQGIELRGISFAEFLYRTAEIEHIHLLSQHKFILNAENKLQVDFVGRFETLATDFQQVCQHLSIQLDLVHKNASIHNSYRQYYDANTSRIIAQRYQVDIEIFKYQF